MDEIRKALVLGCGCSGKAAEKLLTREGVDVYIVDEKTTPDYSFSSLPFIPDVAIVSPGFALTHPWVRELQDHSVPLLSELELGWSRRRSRVVAVTGSNGKSTLVKWITDMLNMAGHSAVACGNYGLPVSEAVMSPDVPEWLVVEVSSFQLETVHEFAPDVGVLLNVLPNHLDRHGDMAVYRSLKLKLFRRMSSSGTALVPYGFIKQGEEMSPCVWQTFGKERNAEYRFCGGQVKLFDLKGTYFDNEVLGSAAAAAAGVACFCGVSREVFERSARHFEPLPHRMQRTAQINGVIFIDDSKATNLAGMGAALRMISGPIHLIAGGRAKETDLSFVKDLLVQRVSRLYLIGEASDMMQAAWGDRVCCVPCGMLEKAVRAAWKSAESGDTVLLSPACTSFDQFRSFSDRGDAFVCEVKKLADRDAGT